MRKVKISKKETDFLKPVIIPDTELDDCFGKEYDSRNGDCSICADLELCGIKFQSKVQAEKKEFEDKKGPFLDQCDFQSIDWKKFEKVALKYEDSGEPMTFAELREAVMEIAKIKNDIAVDEFIRRNLPNTKLELKDGKVYVQRINNNC